MSYIDNDVSQLRLFSGDQANSEGYPYCYKKCVYILVVNYCVFVLCS